MPRSFLVSFYLILTLIISACSNETTTPESTGNLTGTVTHYQTGEPIGSARVFIITDEVAVLQVVDTDRDGFFELSKLPAGGHLLYALKADHTLIESHDARVHIQAGQSTTADMLMEDFGEAEFYTHSILGHVTDSTTGEPVQGAWVMPIGYGEMGNSVRYLMNNSGLVVALTNAHGSYGLGKWPVREYYPDGPVIGLGPVSCAAEGYRPRTFVGSGPSLAHEDWLQGGLLPAPEGTYLRLNIELVPIPEGGLPADEMGSVRGRIVHDGLPQAGVMVTTTMTTLAEPDTIYDANKVATTGGSMFSESDGTFELHLEPGHYALRAGLLPDDGWCRDGTPGMFEIVAAQTLEVGDVGVWPAVIPVSPARGDTVPYPMSRLVWNSFPGAERYEVELNSDMGTYLETTTTDTFYVLEDVPRLPSGTGLFSWQVVATRPSDPPHYHEAIGWFEVPSSFTVVVEGDL